MVRCRLKFTSTDGTAPAPSFVSLSLSWTSDVTAPDAPTISKISSVFPTGGAPGVRVDFGALPAGARHLIVEGKKNGSAYLPFSNRAKFEAGHDYLKFRDDLDAIEAAGERNEAHFSFLKGLAENDVLRYRVAAEDDVGNRSAFTESDEVTIQEQETEYVPVPVEGWAAVWDESINWVGVWE